MGAVASALSLASAAVVAAAIGLSGAALVVLSMRETLRRQTPVAASGGE